MADADGFLPMDEKCLHGSLKNGLAYYIQTNKKPIARCELRLVVKVGSVFETEEECGIAHMVGMLDQAISIEKLIRSLPLIRSNI